MTAALLLAATLMQPGEFTGSWAFTSFQGRPTRLVVSWQGDGLGFSRRAGWVEAFRDPGGPLTIASQSSRYGQACLVYVVTRANRQHTILHGVLELRDWPCAVVVRRGTFRAHRRR